MTIFETNQNLVTYQNHDAMQISILRNKLNSL